MDQDMRGRIDHADAAQPGRRCSERGSWAKPELERFAAGDANQAAGQNVDGVANRS